MSLQASAWGFLGLPGGAKTRRLYLPEPDVSQLFRILKMK